MPTIPLRNVQMRYHLAILQVILQSMNSETFPDDWLSANITPVYTKNDRGNVLNYWPVSLTAICCKVMEYIIYNSFM